MNQEKSPVRMDNHWKWVVSLLVGAGLLTSFGCPQSKTPTVPTQNTNAQSVTLKVFVVDDREVGEAAQRRWQTDGLGELRLTHQTVAEFIAGDFAVPPDFDLIIYPERFQADLSQRQMLLEIPSDIWNSETVNKNDILTHFRGSLIRQGDRYFALPLAGVSLMLMYRQDVLDAIGALPPATWEELELVLEQLAAAEHLVNADGKSLPRGIALPLADDWAAHVLLARSAASVRSVGKLSTLFQVESMSPLIATPPFAEALESLRRLALHHPGTLGQQTPSDTFAALARGDVALAIGWPTGVVTDGATDVSATIRIQRLPGTRRVYDQGRAAWSERPAEDSPQIDYLGIETRVVSVLRNSLNATEALRFAAWLSSKRTSQQVSPFSMANGPYRNSQLSDLGRWTGESISPDAAEDYAQAIAASHQAKLILSFPRIVEQYKYLEILAQSVRSFLGNGDSAAITLQMVSDRWHELTTRIGPRVQRDFLRRGEGF